MGSLAVTKARGANRALWAVMLGAAVLIAGPRADAQYRTYTQIGTLLQDAETTYPSLCKRYDLGSSVQGRSLWALRISDNVLVEEDEPEFKYISSMHGDEIMGMEMCLHLIEYLTTNYGSDAQVTDIVDSVELWIVPLMNPDGFDRVSRTRNNANGVNLNRDFPDPYTSPNNTPTGRAPETGVIMNWSFGRSFTLAANFHGGALLVNYPFDNNEEGASVYTASPDDDMFIYISEEYSRYNLPMWNGSFYHGISNGADWYAISGGMQDWSYHYMGCNEVTIEISNSKEPPASQIPAFWDDNRESMLAYIETVLIGVRGVVTDAATGLPVAATFTVDGRDHEVYTDPDVGDYHRMLMPGAYTVRVEAPGYDVVTYPDIVVNSGDATRWDVSLVNPLTETVYPNGGEELAVGVSTEVTWSGNSTTPYHVQYSPNYGDTDAVTDGFEGGALGPDYDTGGDRGWIVTSSSSHSGFYAARAGTITHGENSWLTRDSGPGYLSFWYRVSSESGWDYFNFYIDGDRELHLSGTVNWTQYSTTLGPGTHVLKWEYFKDGSESDGSDTAWIDDLEISVDNTTWADVIGETPPGALTTTWIPSVDGESCKVRVRAIYGDGAYGGWDESDATFTVLPGPQIDAPLPAAPPDDVRKNRYISFDPNDSESVAFTAELTASTYFPESVGPVGWVGEPDGNGVSRLVDEAYYSDAWPTVVHIGDCPIVPVAVYEIRATNGVMTSNPVEVSTVTQPDEKWWADIVGAKVDTDWSPPDGFVNMDDIQAAIQSFEVAHTPPPWIWADIEDEVPNAVINMTDVQFIVLAFEGAQYPFSAPADCP